MELNLSSLENFSPDPELDLSSLESFAPDNTVKSTTKVEPTSPTSSIKLDLSSLEEVPSTQSQLNKPTEEIRSKFGLRKDPFLGTTKFHNGIDLKFPLNTPVKSLGKGLVVDVGNSGKKNYGKYVTVDYGGGLELTYGHLNEQKVERGDLLSSDAILGLSGNTGRSTGAHLHIKAMLNGQPVDPTKYFSNSANIVNGVTSDQNVVDEVPKLDLSSLAGASQRTTSQISISGADIIHHLGFDPTKVEGLNPSLKSHIISQVNKAVESDRIKRENGQTEFPVDFNYQNSMRKKVGLPQMNSIMQQFKNTTNSNFDNEGISFGNHTEFPIIYNLASKVAPETQAIHRNNLVEDYKEEIRKNLNKKPASYSSGNIVGMDYFLPNMSEEEITKSAEKAADQQLAIEEQMHLDSISKTARFTKNIISSSGAIVKQGFPGINTEDVTRGLTETLGSWTKNIGDWSAVLYPTEVTEDIQSFGRQIQAGAFLQKEENPTSGSFFSNIQRGIGEGVGRSPELIKLYAGAELLGPELAGANLPLQGAISSVSEGPTGMMKGALGGIVYHYGGGLTAPYLGRVGNSLLWIAAPAAEAHLIGGQDLATAIGSNIPMGLFIGISGGERAKVIDGNTIRSANFSDIPKIQSGEINFVPPSYRVGFEKGKVIEELARRFNSVPLNIEVPNSKFTIPVPTAEANLRLLDLKKELVVETDVTKQQKIQASIEVLEKGIPEDVKKFYLENEEAIRAGINIEVARKDELEKQPIFKNGKLREDVGEKNTWGTSANKAEEILNNFTKIGNNRLRVNLPFAPGADILARKVGDLSYLTAFFIEDFYHRGVEPTISLVRNRLRETLGDFSSHLKDETLKEAFDKGFDYFKSNNADPFFSRMKQDANEKLPNRFTAEQAQNILKQHVDEFGWTAGLEEFFKENDGKKISKQELIDVIQKGQVRVEASVASNETTKELEQLYADKNLYYEQIHNRAASGEEDIKENLRQQIYEIQKRIDELEVGGKVKYSLKAYAEEKLELPGAVNSKEVKLITPIAEAPKIIDLRQKLNTIKEDIATTATKLQIKFPDFSNTIKYFSGEYGTNISKEVPNRWPDELGLELHRLSQLKEEKIQLENEQYRLIDTDSVVKYQAPHWDEPNVVAHYRSNDRTTTDNIPIHFSEEFQSDWMHDIREKGAKAPANLSLENYEQYGYEARLIKNIFHGADSWIFGLKDKLSETQYDDTLTSTKFMSKEDAVREFIKNLKADNSNLVERNPFMSHAWKELVFKRFLRDAVIAKDENGNYKYEGIGWTTARQQQERSGAVLEGKDFVWMKNSDNTYTFTFNEQQPHELRNISLERFAELTTKEAAEEVRSQEAKVIDEKNFHDNIAIDYNEYASGRQWYVIDKSLINKSPTISYIVGNGKTREAAIEDYLRGGLYNESKLQGKFSLKEAVELRSGIGKYSDYDVAFVNYAKKIGKRFGASYNLKQIETKDADVSFSEFLEAKGIPIEEMPNVQYEKLAKEYNDYEKKINENIHFLEITPSMRESLSKEGFPLYGLGGSEKLKSQDLGTRNSIVSSEAFDQHRNDLVKSLTSLENDISEPDSISGQRTILNSGLSPDAFIDQTKLLYKGIREFLDFSKQLITRFGESINPFIQDLWVQAKDLLTKFNEDQRGFLNLSKIDPRNLGLTKKKAASEYLTDPEKHQSRLRDLRFITSSTGLAQFNPKFGRVYNDLVAGQRATNGFNSFILDSFREANSFLKKENHDQVGKVLYNGLVEEGRVFSRAELLIGNFAVGRPALNAKQADAYENLYKAQHLSLDLRRETILHGVRERLNRTNAQLAAATLGTQAYNSLLNKRIAINNNIKGISDYYDNLKSSGYFSLQRKGPIAAYIEDAKGEKVYQQFGQSFSGEHLYRQGLRKAQNWIDEQIANGANPNTQSIYDLRKINDISSLSKKLSIGAFEDLVDSSGVNSHSPEIEKLRDEIYSQFSSTGYQLKRDFTAGFERTWESAVTSVIRQAELYSSSFYSRVSKEEALKTLSDTGIQKTDPNLYQIAKAYIEDETIATESAPLVKGLGKARQAVYVIKLGYDFSQLYLNAIFQPITQTYGYFARVIDQETGNRLKGIEPEKYFTKGTKLALDLAKDYFTKTKTTYQNPRFAEFKTIYDRLVNERIVEPEFSKSLLELETDTLGKDITQTALQKATSAQQHLHWAGVFMRAGEKVTRTQAAATAFLVGKEKFGYSGDKLTDFIVQAVNATQSNPTRGDNPYVARRSFGASAASSEAGKLVYQFNKFNQMWVENLALSIKADFEKTWDTSKVKDLPANLATDFIANKARATTRMLYPLLIIGGLKGLPLAGLAFTLYTLLSGNDSKDKFDKAFGNHKTLESMALYGVTGNTGFSGKVTPNIPFIDTLGTDRSTIPLYSTSEQIIKGLYDLSPLSKEKTYEKGIEETLSSAVPFGNAISRILKAHRYANQGIPIGKAKRKATRSEYIGQAIGITPSRIVENFEQQRTKRLLEIHKKLKKAL